MIQKHLYFTLLALMLIACTAEADENAWGATTSGSMVKIDATTGTLLNVLYNTQPYTNFILLDSVTKNPDPSMWIALNPNGTLYGIDSSGNLYTINTANLTQGANSSNIGFLATKGNSSGVSNPTGATFISATVLDISTSTILYSYNLTSTLLTNVGSFTNANISGLAYNTALLRLFGVKYLPSSTGIDLISGVSLTGLPNSNASALSQSSCLFAGATLLYLSDGSSSFYSYNTTSTVLTKLSSTLGSGLHSLTAISAGGSSGTPTPSPTPNPTQTPTPTPTPTPTAIPTTGTLTLTPVPPPVIALESTPGGDPKCAASLSYTVTASSSIPPGTTLDPTCTLAVNRSYETTNPDGSYASPLPATPIAYPCSWSPASTTLHFTISPSFIAGQDGSAQFYYGRETLQLVYFLTANPTTPHPLGTPTKVYLYPWNTGQSPQPSATITNAFTNAAVQGNPSPYADPSPSPYLYGDPPRIKVQMNNLYPSGTSSVIIYNGTPITNPTATGSTTIQTAVAPSSGLWTPQAVTFELASCIDISATSPQTYTIAAVQQLPSANYAVNSSNPVILNTVTFTIMPGFNVNGTVGTVK